jgi:hypothetical protein
MQSAYAKIAALRGMRGSHPHDGVSDPRFTEKTGKLMNSNAIELQSTITCPQCGHSKEETMPMNACMFFYLCQGCGTRLQPKHGACCVFCSYATVPCPPIQLGTGRTSHAREKR